MLDRVAPRLLLSGNQATGSLVITLQRHRRACHRLWLVISLTFPKGNFVPTLRARPVAKYPGVVPRPPIAGNLETRPQNANAGYAHLTLHRRHGESRRRCHKMPTESR